MENELLVELIKNKINQDISKIDSKMHGKILKKLNKCLHDKKLNERFFLPVNRELFFIFENEITFNHQYSNNIETFMKKIIDEKMQSFDLRLDQNCVRISFLKETKTWHLTLISRSFYGGCLYYNDSDEIKDYSLIYYAAYLQVLTERKKNKIENKINDIKKMINVY